MAEAISLAKELNDMHALVVLERFWAPEFCALAGWRRGSPRLGAQLGDTAKGVSLLENGIADNRATGSILLVPRFLALKAEALNLADRTSEALETIGEAEALAENLKGAGGVPNCTGSAARFSRPWVPRRSELSFILRSHQNRREQKSISLEKRAEGTYEEYCRQKASGAGGAGFRLPLYGPIAVPCIPFSRSPS